MATATKEKKLSTRELRQKIKVEQRKRMDEIKSLALRQGYVTEDQIVWQLGEELEPEDQVDLMEEVHSMLNDMPMQVFALTSISALGFGLSRRMLSQVVWPSANFFCAR